LLAVAVSPEVEQLDEPIFIPEDWELGTPWRRLARGVGTTQGVCQVIEPSAEVVDDLSGNDAPLDWWCLDDLHPVDAVSCVRIIVGQDPTALDPLQETA
jgi:hypothetical protein